MTRALEQKRPQLRDANAASAAALDALVDAELRAFEVIGAWALEVQQYSEPDRAREGPSVVQAFAEWSHRVDPLMRQVDAMARQGRDVTHLTEFCHAVAEARVYGDPERARHAADPNPRGIPLEEAMRELRRRAETGRA